MKTSMLSKVIRGGVMLIFILSTGLEPPVSNAFAMGPGITLEVHPEYDLVYAIGFPPGITLQLLVKDAGDNLLSEITTITVPDPWNSSRTIGDFSNTGFDFIAGQKLELLSSGMIFKSYTIPNPQVTQIDINTDIVTGTGTSGSRMLVCANPDQCIYRWANIDQNGNWMVSFAPSMMQPGTFDIQPGSNGWAVEINAVGDKTWTNDWFVPNSNCMINAHLNENFIVGLGWPVGSTVTLLIEDTKTTKSPDYSDTKIVEDTAPWDQSLGRVFFDLNSNFLLEAGQVVAISDGTSSKTYTIMDLYATSFNFTTRIVTGHADQGATVRVNVRSSDGDSVEVNADENGNWIAHLAGSSEAFYYDDNGGAISCEPDGDCTFYSLSPGIMGLNPVNDDFSLGWGLPYQDYELAIDDPATTLPVDYQLAFTTNFYEEDGGFDFYTHLDGFDLKPGDVVTLTTRHFVKTIVVHPPVVPNFNIIADTINGTGRPGEWIGSYLPGTWRDARIDPVGTWSADFSTALAPDSWNGAVDILPGQEWAIFQIDDDHDSTLYYNTVSLPSSGSAIGEGWFDSPAGAYSVNPDFSGKAVIDLSTHYVDSKTLPVGGIQFNFRGFAFSSSNLDWMAIQDGRMQLTGSGKINGKGGYGFMIISASGSGFDLVRIRIWNKGTNQVVYDTQPGAADNVLPITVLQDGSITFKIKK